jgi:hypothetical protein
MRQYLILPLLSLWVTPVFGGEYVELSLDSFLHIQSRLAKVPGWSNAVKRNLESVEGYRSDDIVNCAPYAYQYWTYIIDKWEKDRNFYRIRHSLDFLYWETYYATVEIRNRIHVVEYLTLKRREP